MNLGAASHASPTDARKERIENEICKVEANAHVQMQRDVSSCERKQKQI
jgi:hypothetical protein